MKKLNRLLLINWHYFTKELIDFGTINFITGINGAGKSTIVDAMQVVLMGETRSNAFNSAANTEKRSERTLKSYLIGSLGEDVETGDKSLRGGMTFTTYIVAEIYDDVKDDFFCFGAVFDSFADGGEIRRKFFRLADSIPKSCFIDNKTAMNTKQLMLYFKENYPQNKYEIMGTAEAYRDCLRTRLNVNDPNLFVMLKKAISFKPIGDIEKFITEYVCDIEDNIDITSMQENISHYMHQLDMAKAFEDKLKALEAIKQAYENVERFRALKKRQTFLMDYAAIDELELQLDFQKQTLIEYDKKIDDAQKRYDSLKENIDELSGKKNKLISDRNKYWADSKGDFLEDKIKRYEDFIEKSRNSIKNSTLNIRQGSGKWLEIIDNLSQLNPEKAEPLCGQLEMLGGICEDKLSEYSLEFFRKINLNFTELKDFFTPIISEQLFRRKELKSDILRLKQTISRLENGIMSYPERAIDFKNAIKQELEEQVGHSVRVDFFADLIEISDEQWHNAIEGYLNTQRMYLIIDPQYYHAAYKIYKKIRHEKNIHEYRIVDCERVLGAHKSIVENNLAQVITTDNKYARAYADYLMGGVTRCYDDAKIRDYKKSVTRECMIYSGYSFGTLNKDVYNCPFIGRNSIETQIKINRDRLNQASSDLDKANDFLKKLQPISGEWFLTESYIDSTVAAMYSAAEDVEEYSAELKTTIDEFNKINITWLSEVDGEIKKYEQMQKRADEEKEQVLSLKVSLCEKRRDTAEKIIPEIQEKIAYSRAVLDGTYGTEYITKIKAEFYDEELKKRKTPRAIIDGFKAPLEGTKTQLKRKEDELLLLKSDYNRVQNVSFNIGNTENNNDYEKEYVKIKDTQLPYYKEKIEEAKESAMEQFKSDFLFRLKDNIEKTYEQIALLNKALKRAKFGNDRYSFVVTANPAYEEYFNMIKSEELMQGGDTLFSYGFTSKYQTTLDNLFSQIVHMSDNDSEAYENVALFSKYKTYLSFDIFIHDSKGGKQSAVKTINKKSGGETQTPFYVAVLASFAQLYRVSDKKESGNTFRLVIFDEAFSKMDSERIAESVKLLRQFGLQAVVCTPTDKISDIAPLADKTYLVYKESVKNGYRSDIVGWTKEMSDEDDELSE